MLVRGDLPGQTLAGVGGNGDPLKRDPQTVIGDVADEKVLVESASGLQSGPRRACRPAGSPRRRRTARLAPGRAGSVSMDDGSLGCPTHPLAPAASAATMMDRPWSQYFCCVVAGNRDFVRTNPAAAKRATRALLKANQVCAVEPDRVARFLVDRGYTQQYDYAHEAIRETPYGEWHEFDAEDTVRFWSLRLHEAGMIKSSPDKILAQGTDWRFFNELKQELKA